MTTPQLTKLKDAGFTLEQIIAIGEIFEPDPHAAKSPDPENISVDWKRIYEEMKPTQQRPIRRPKDFDPQDPGFIRQIERINRQREQEGLLLMDASPQSKGGKARAAALSPERRSEVAKQAAQARWNTQTFIES